MPGKKVVIFVLSALVVFATGCKKPVSGASHSAKAYTTINWADSGTISGVIHFEGKAPKRIPIDMAQDPVCAMSPPNLTQQYVVNDGGLANVVVYVKSGLGDKAYTPSSTPVVMDQKGCRFVPHVLAVMAGQPVEFTDSDNTMHNVHITPTVAANQAVNVSEGPNNPDATRMFAAPEMMMPVRCNNHPWMLGYISVIANPFFDVSNADGDFTIKGVPPGTYTIVADHEMLGPKTATVTVTAGHTTHLDFTYEMPANAKMPAGRR